jgi:hypothetical protein
MRAMTVPTALVIAAAALYRLRQRLLDARLRGHDIRETHERRIEAVAPLV